MAQKKDNSAATKKDESDDEKPELVKISFLGHTFTVPKSKDDWETRAIIEFGRAQTLDDQIKGIELQLGPAQWTLLVDKVAPTAGLFKQFTDLFMDVVRAEVTN